MAATNTNCLVGALVACIILLVLSLNISLGGRMPSSNEFVNSMPTLTRWVQDAERPDVLLLGRQPRPFPVGLLPRRGVGGVGGVVGRRRP